MAPITTASNDETHAALLDQLDMQKLPKPFRNPNWKPPQRRNKNLKQILSEAQRAQQSIMNTQQNSGATTPQPMTDGEATTASLNPNPAQGSQDLSRLVLDKNAKQANGGGGLAVPSNPTLGPSVTYTSIQAPPSLKPKIKYCDITGLPSAYTDPKTGLQYYNAEIYQIIKGLNTAQVQEYLAIRNANTVLKRLEIGGGNLNVPSKRSSTGEGTIGSSRRPSIGDNIMVSPKRTFTAINAAAEKPRIEQAPLQFKKRKKGEDHLEAASSGASASPSASDFCPSDDIDTAVRMGGKAERPVKKRPRMDVTSAPAASTGRKRRTGQEVTESDWYATDHSSDEAVGQILQDAALEAPPSSQEDVRHDEQDQDVTVVSQTQAESSTQRTEDTTAQEKGGEKSKQSRLVREIAPAAPNLRVDNINTKLVYGKRRSAMRPRESE